MLALPSISKPSYVSPLNHPTRILLRPIVAFPAQDKNFEDQLSARCLIRYMIRLNRSFFFLPNSSGNPKYFPRPPSFSILRICLARSLVSSLVFWGYCYGRFICVDHLSWGLFIFPKDWHQFMTTLLFWSAQEHGIICKKKVILSWTA